MLISHREGSAFDEKNARCLDYFEKVKQLTLFNLGFEVLIRLFSLFSFPYVLECRFSRPQK